MFRLIRFLLLLFSVFFLCRPVSAQFPFTETFKYATASHLTFDSITTNKELNSAFLTAGKSIDPNGSGYLRLTNNLNGQVGFVYSTKKFPSAKGFSVDFEYFTYGGEIDKADGICFFLFDANANPFNIGAFGGALGYAQRELNGEIFPGVSKGYLGVGIDEWGNFPNSTEGRQGGVAWREPNSIALRGAGDGSALTPDNYPLLITKRTNELPIPFEITGENRNAISPEINGYRKVIIELEPRTGGGYFVTVKVQFTEGGVTKTSLVIDSYPYVTPAPEYLRFGFAASTGGGINYHEIRNINFNLPSSQTIEPPTANDDIFSIKQNDLSGLVVKDVAANDVGNNPGSGLDRNTVDLDPDESGIQSVKIVPGKGTFKSVSGKVNFIPENGNISGTVSIKYTIQDDYGGSPSNPANITVNIIPGPRAGDDVITALEDTPITFNALINDTGTDESILDPASIDLEPYEAGRQTEKTIPGQGKFTANDDGTITFTPEPNFNGTVDPVLYTVTDDKGALSNTATILITINPVNDAPEAADDIITTDEDTPVTYDISANDTDVDGNASIDKASINFDPGGERLTEKTIPGQGIIKANNDGTVTFIPEANFNGAVEPISYIIADNEGLFSNPAFIYITVNPVNDAPVAADDEIIIKNGEPVTFNVIDNDTDVEGNNTIDKTSINLDPDAPERKTEKTIPGQGKFTANDDGTVTFTPVEGFAGPVTVILYTIKDMDGAESAPAQIKVTVTGPAEPKIGLAKKLETVSKTGNNSYTVSFLFTIKNFGEDQLEKVSLKDDLKAAFPEAEITVNNLSVSPGGLKVNSLYNGSTDIELLLTESKLQPGETAEVSLKVNIKLLSPAQLFKNSARVEAFSPITNQTVSDKSTDGLKPDPQSPGDVSPALETEIRLEDPEIFIPTGFSPNKDGINDRFIIDNPLSKRISLEIYNRWGNRIYKNSDYKNDWEGICSEGIRIGEEVPDGTYFYIVVIENGTRQVGQLTVKR